MQWFQMFKKDLNIFLVQSLSESFTNPSSNKAINTLRDEIESAHQHPLKAGGKRVRPFLLAATAHSLSYNTNKSNKILLIAAAALELVHTYSLVHDDLPCMDDDSFRRGVPTTHKVYGENKALLVGDGLLTHAFLLLSSLKATDLELSATSKVSLLSQQLIQVLSKASGICGMVYGQWLDISSSQKKSPHQNNNSTELESWKFLEEIHLHKTGYLLGCAMEMGALCGAVTQQNFDFEKQIDSENFVTLKQSAHKIGQLIGLTFQIVDDILDATQSSVQLGKTPGKDKINNKLTAVSLLGVEGAKKTAKEFTDSAFEHMTQFETTAQKMGLQFSADHWQELKKFISDLLSRKN